MNKKNTIFLISGPSGVGKDTVIKTLNESNSNIKNIVSTNIRSEGITKGAIQVPANGQPIILLTDYPTIGGYPKIANVISADYDLLAQKTPGEKVLFKYVELHEAEKIYKEYLINIAKVIKDIKEIH